MAKIYGNDMSNRERVKKWILKQLDQEEVIYPKDVVAAFAGRRNRSSINRDLCALRSEGVIGRGRKARIVLATSQ